MTVLAIRLWPDPILQTNCLPVAKDGASDGARDGAGDVATLVQDMLETMYDAPGRGLAAPQVGVALRLFVMDCAWKTGPRQPMVCINPEIIQASETRVGGEEGCLSIPGVSADVMRPAQIVLRFTDADGTRQERELSGIEAKCAQHELDHLNGRVIFDHLPPDAAQDLAAEYARAQTTG
ncbi:peptide deformylase [Phaeobacter sp. J2-8]|uniref:peptide deformylase n=1 Tax=Phaeobacter sp. J2-8 TaxID=2931394 RepID=UPI001FD15A56|nr:peptide deformylase [Phaeobacter sp. J2-8]